MRLGYLHLKYIRRLYHYPLSTNPKISLGLEVRSEKSQKDLTFIANEFLEDGHIEGFITLSVFSIRIDELFFLLVDILIRIGILHILDFLKMNEILRFCMILMLGMD